MADFQEKNLYGNVNGQEETVLDIKKIESKGHTAENDRLNNTENGTSQKEDVNFIVSMETKKTKKKRHPCEGGCSVWCKKYFWEGQELSDSAVENRHKELAPGAAFYKVALTKYRRVVALFSPAVLVYILWLSIMIKYDLWYVFKTKYAMTITMVFGGLVAGMTSEGGGAVAFPVMTLLLGVSAVVARDFSVCIQATGMSCASFAILFMGVIVEWHAVVLGSIGGLAGLLFGFYQVDPYLSPSEKKMGFVSIWFSFAFALFLLNCLHTRRTFNKIPNFNMVKGLILVVTGFAGGICTSFAGNGLDICTFSMLTLLFRVSEKVATPTSVLLMAFNSLFAVFWRQIIMGGMSQETWEYLAVTAQIVVIGAPTGSVLGTHFHRLVLAGCIYILDTASLVTAYIVIPLTPLLIGASVGIMAGGFVFFGIITYIGHRLIQKYEAAEKEQMLTHAVDVSKDGDVDLVADGEFINVKL